MKDRKKPMTEKEVSLVVQEAETLVQALDPLPEKIQKLNMNRDEDYESLLEEGRVVREMEKQLEVKQKWALEPSKEAIKRTKSLFKPLLNACVEVLELVDRKQSEFFQIQERKQQLEQQKLDLEAAEEQKRLERNARARVKRLLEREDHSREARERAKEIISNVPEIEPLEAEEIIAPKVNGVSVAKIWDFEIEDPGMVPEFFEIEEAPNVRGHYALWHRQFHRETLLKICRTMMTADGNLVVPGVRFFQKDSTRYGRL